MAFLGFDVGFSATARSSGIARLSASCVFVNRATCVWEAREPFLRLAAQFDVAAIDAPLVPDGFFAQRPCETIFSCGAFQRQCKPGMSHVCGTGQKLRAAGDQTAAQIAHLVSGHILPARFPRIHPKKNLVEAFPNAYLGVLLPESAYEQAGKIRRGEKFDWLYGQCLDLEVFPSILRTLKLTRRIGLLEKLCANRNHDERAALICLLTAAGVATGKYTAVGNAHGGYFFLPPWRSWQAWAQQALACGRARGGNIDVWIDGQCFSGVTPIRK